ncbi:LytR/AlgR family response regulator transcription factor [Enterococcus sp. AZ126]|uniref:LytR/AlgR family response regulator transcription factor n=1 Tax=Enterococcus sp. AZ126 TaxID=2774635 RepID=UPI003F204249
MIIYVIEDDNQQRKQIIHYLNECKKCFFDLELSKFSNHLTFMEEISKLTIKDNDVFFLDIDLKTTYTGIDLALEIRKYNTKCSIIFLTSLEDKAISVLNNNIFPLGYLIKNLENPSETKQIITEMIKKSQITSKNFWRFKQDKVEFSSGSETLFFNARDICYIHTLKKFHGRILIKTLNEETIIEAKIGKLKKQLQQEYMMTSLQSYILNLENIISIDRKNEHILFAGHQLLSIGAKSIDKVKKALRVYSDDR